MKTSKQVFDLLLDKFQDKSDESLSSVYKTRAEGGHPDSIIELSRCYIDGKHNTKKDIEKGMSLLEDAAAKGHVKAIESLANRLLEGYGTAKKRKTRAKELLRDAFDKGNIDAGLNLGERLLNGDGLRTNVSGAVEVLKDAYEKGSQEAAYKLYKVYKHGGKLNPFTLEQSNKAKFHRNNLEGLRWLVKSTSGRNGLWDAREKCIQEYLWLYKDLGKEWLESLPKEFRKDCESHVLIDALGDAARKGCRWATLQLLLMELTIEREKEAQGWLDKIMERLIIKTSEVSEFLIVACRLYDGRGIAADHDLSMVIFKRILNTMPGLISAKREMADRLLREAKDKDDSRRHELVKEAKGILAEDNNSHWHHNFWEKDLISPFPNRTILIKRLIALGDNSAKEHLYKWSQKEETEGHFDVSRLLIECLIEGKILQPDKRKAVSKLMSWCDKGSIGAQIYMTTLSLYKKEISVDGALGTLKNLIQKKPHYLLIHFEIVEYVHYEQKWIPRENIEWEKIALKLEEYKHLGLTFEEEDLSHALPLQRNYLAVRILSRSGILRNPKEDNLLSWRWKRILPDWLQ